MYEFTKMMNPIYRVAEIEKKLKQAFSPEYLEVIDDSMSHAGHAGALTGKGHFIVKIKSQAFNEKSKIITHRLIYQALGELMDTDIHALSIHILRDDS